MSMPDLPKLSIIIIFQNQRDVVESTIDALYELPLQSFELILIDDGSTDDTGDIIHSLIEYYRHVDTYFFDRSEQFGKGRSLNEALFTVSGDFLWIVDALDEVSESELTNVLENLKSSEKLVSVNSGFLPSLNEETWRKLIEEKKFPSNQSFIWNWKKIPPHQQFFNPYMEDGQAAELALRIISEDDQYTFHEDVYQSSVEESIIIDDQSHTEFLFSVLRKQNNLSDLNRRVFKIIAGKKDIEVRDDAGTQFITHEHHPDTNAILDQARRLHREGNNAVSLELLNKILANDPDNIPGKKLKIAVLERMHRYVEAAEIKHTIPEYARNMEEETEQEDLEEDETIVEAEESPTVEESVTSENGEQVEQPEQQPVHEKPEEILTSVIIPTTSDRKLLLERCLVALGKYTSPKNTELIIVDNASLDDTCDYLDQLVNDRFFNCKVVVNSQNVGFAQSINMGMEKAVGKYICAMHNDVFLTSNALDEMQEIMDENPDYGAIGPCTRHTLNPEQITDNPTNERNNPLTPADYLDSFCMFFRSDLNLHFDEQYELAYFEDIDFCLQIRDHGWKIGIAPDINVDHLFGITTSDLGINPESPQYWKNIERFNHKWDIQTVYPEDKIDLNIVDRLLILNQIMNPHYPESHLLQLYSDWFTSEVKTDILEKDWDRETLIGLVELMMKADQRDVLRQLEDKLEHIELPEDILYELVNFYYERNIFSRCDHYMEEVKGDDLPFRFRLIRLKIAVIEKDMMTAVPLLNELLEEIPSHPDLYKLSGDIHSLEGNTREAKRFYELATQIDPFRYPATDSAYSLED